jgi:hypothetical protein
MTVAKTLMCSPGGEKLEAERDKNNSLTLVASSGDTQVRIHLPDEYLDKLAQAIIDMKRVGEPPEQRMFASGFMCKTDFETELGMTPVVIYPSLDRMERECPCTPPGEATCGIVAVDVMFRCLERMPDVGEPGEKPGEDNAACLPKKQTSEV